MDLQLKNKRALITGGSIGIGLAVAESLAMEGVHLILCARNKERLEENGGAISEKYGVEVDCVATDVSNAEDLQNLLDHVNNNYSSIDIFINNAGQGSDEKIETASDEKWQYYWDLHVMAAIRLSRGFVLSISRTY